MPHQSHWQIYRKCECYSLDSTLPHESSKLLSMSSIETNKRSAFNSCAAIRDIGKVSWSLSHALLADQSQFHDISLRNKKKQCKPFGQVPKQLAYRLYFDSHVDNVLELTYEHAISTIHRLVVVVSITLFYHVSPVEAARWFHI